jgi:hypothetical protein
MLQAVVDPSALKMATQYITENRVRIMEANDEQIAGAVIGSSGLYELMIRLKGGQLQLKCSCTSGEQPICRHGAAVLLEYHRWAQPKEGVPKPAAKPVARDEMVVEVKATPVQPTQPAITASATAPSGGGGLSALGQLREVSQFLEWLPTAVNALEQCQALPSAPAFTTPEMATCTQAFEKIEERRRRSDGKLFELETDLSDREEEIGRVKQELDQSRQEAKQAQTSNQQLTRELDSARTTLTKLGEMSKDFRRFDEQMKNLSREIVKRGDDLDQLATSLQKTSTMFQDSVNSVVAPKVVA